MLCGLYSVLNSIQLALYPRRLARPELQRIYVRAIEHLSRRRQLKRVIGVGVDYPLWAKLQTELIAYVNQIYGASLNAAATLQGTAVRDRKRAIDTIKRAIGGGSPVLAGFGGVLDHYSVIAGYTGERLILFDSSGLQWIQAENLGLGEGSPRTHWILPDQTMSVVDDW